MTHITTRLSVEWPDAEGDYAIQISGCGDYGEQRETDWITRAEADAIIAALQVSIHALAPMRARTSVVYSCDRCGYCPTVEAETHVARGCDRTNCNGTQRPLLWPNSPDAGQATDGGEK